MPDTSFAKRPATLSPYGGMQDLPDDVRAWHHAVQSGDVAAGRGDHQAATGHYRCALATARSILVRAVQTGNPAGAPALVVASHHRLADGALMQGEHAAALDHFRAAFEETLRLVQVAGLPAAVRQSCASQLQPSLTALATRMLASGGSLRALQKDIRAARRVNRARDAGG